MATLHITDIESAINWWRERKPSPDGITACAEVRALAGVYAQMAIEHVSERDEDAIPPDALAAWLAWYASTPDAPCIAICSTSQGDDICKGCGRTFEEVQHWTVMTPAEKRQTWRRITLEGTAWRFNRYAERAREAGGVDPAPFGEDAVQRDVRTTSAALACAPAPARGVTKPSARVPIAAPAMPAKAVTTSMPARPATTTRPATTATTAASAASTTRSTRATPAAAATASTPARRR